MSAASSQFEAYKVAEKETNELLKKFDKNGDGVLTKEELPEFLNHIARARGSIQLKNHESASEIPKVCSKPKRQLVLNKAPKFPTRVVNGKASNMALSREHLKEIFKFHDGDEDGFLNKRDLTKAFSHLGSILPFDKAHYGLGLADADNDGLISQDELDKLIDYAFKIVKKK